jgi:hypothetical protein
MKLLKIYKFETYITGTTSEELEELLDNAELTGIPLSEEELENGTITNQTIVLAKSALDLKQVEYVVQEYIDASGVTKAERKQLQAAFINYPSFKLIEVPILRVHLKSGSVMFNVIGTMEYFLKYFNVINDAKVKNN